MSNPLTITQILWVNLVMDTLAALAFGGEPALRRFMHEKPKRRDESIISQSMWSSIGVGAGYTVIISLILLLAGNNWFYEWRYFPEIHMTGYFALFIFIAVFNAFNARTEEINLLDNITRNKNFLKIMGLVAVIQVLLTYLGGNIFQCYGLNIEHWLLILILAFAVIPVDILRKSVIKMMDAENK
jgi:magnesium-transporting ATPase (P-type)